MLLTLLTFCILTLSSGQLCSLDFNIKCHFKYKSNKNCNRIGQSCSSFRVLEWLNMTDNSKSCNFNSGNVISNNFDLDGYSICNNVGPQTKSGIINSNCFCNSNGIEEFNKRFRSTSSISFNELPVPTRSPTLSPTIIPTQEPTTEPVILIEHSRYDMNLNAYLQSTCSPESVTQRPMLVKPSYDGTAAYTSMCEVRTPGKDSVIHNLANPLGTLIFYGESLSVSTTPNLPYMCWAGNTVLSTTDETFSLNLICDGNVRIVRINPLYQKERLIRSTGNFQILITNNSI